ncbi:MAG: hypothetical protein PHH22_03655 [Clostridia bacterium]|nr:hypothetical protein [Clostridia bacterium]
MNAKKIVLIIVLVLLIGGIVTVLVLSSNNKKDNVNDNNNNNNNNEDINSVSNKIDVVISDKYFITQLNEIYLNTEDYLGKVIEIEGFPLSNGQYNFVARYGPGCCSNDAIAYLEYEYDKDLELIDEKDWIKIIGEICKGKDENGSEYIYIDASSVEKKDIRGVDTVTH